MLKKTLHATMITKTAHPRATIIEIALLVTISTEITLHGTTIRETAHKETTTEITRHLTTTIKKAHH
jgi:hypothetical protein